MSGSSSKNSTAGLILLLIGLVTMSIAAGCRDRQSATSPTAIAPTVTTRPEYVYLSLAKRHESLKLQGVTVTVTNAAGFKSTQTFNTSQLPVQTGFQLPYPPCSYQITATGDLSLGGARTAVANVNVCQFDGNPIVLTIVPYEPFMLAGSILSGPVSAAAGATIDISCDANLTVPDTEDFPIRVDLNETGGKSRTGTFNAVGDRVTASFSDPFGMAESPVARSFTCTLTSAGGTIRNASHTVRRQIPTPTPEAGIPEGPYTVGTASGGAGAGAVAGGGSYMTGDRVTLSATADADSTFAGWTLIGVTNPGACTGSTSPCTFSMPANAVSATAQFNLATVTTYAVTTSTSGTGTSTVSGDGNYAAGDTVTLSATADADSTFAGWTLSGVTNPGACTGATSPCSFTMPANAVSATAQFNPAAATTYAVTTSTSGTGTGTVSGDGNYTAGDTVTLSATANTGSTFAAWSLTGVTAPGTCTGAISPCSFTMPANAVSATAQFNPAAATTYAVTTSTSGTGTGTVSGDGNYAAGDTITLSATANTGSTFAGWTLIDVTDPGTCTGATSPCTFTMPANAVTGIAQFNTLPTYTVTITPWGAGTGTVAGGGDYAAGDTVTLSANAAALSVFAGWTLYDVTDPGTCTGVTSPCSFTMPDNAVSGLAQFLPDYILLWATTDFISTGGNLGGVTGANTICQSDAAAQGISGTVAALISSSTQDARDVVPPSEQSRPVSRTNRVTEIGANWADLWDGTLDASSGGSGGIWAGSNTDGTVQTGLTCNDWMSNDPAMDAAQGLANNADSLWIANGAINCGNLFRKIYCVAY